MDKVGAPILLWFFCLLYVVTVLNDTALQSLNWITPWEDCFAVTPDISVLLQYTFYQPVYYSYIKSFFNTQDKIGH